MSNNTIKTKKKEESTWKKVGGVALAFGGLALAILGKKGNNNA